MPLEKIIRAVQNRYDCWTIIMAVDQVCGEAEMGSLKISFVFDQHLVSYIWSTGWVCNAPLMQQPRNRKTIEILLSELSHWCIYSDYLGNAHGNLNFPVNEWNVELLCNYRGSSKWLTLNIACTIERSSKRW